MVNCRVGSFDGTISRILRIRIEASQGSLVPRRVPVGNGQVHQYFSETKDIEPQKTTAELKSPAVQELGTKCDHLPHAAPRWWGRVERCVVRLRFADNHVYMLGIASLFKYCL
jgi:hypothetical protein